MVTLTKAQALDRVRSLDRSHLKLAGLGGDGQDQAFEQSFSNLAHAYLRDLAPSLLDHELGFQLLDRNEDNTKAIGVFGFKVGSQLLFAPVFFLQGDLKGHELLYLKDQDLFVPMSEGWLNYILNRKPNILGDQVTRNTAQLGVRQPDMARLGKSPWKYASWVGPLLPKIAATALTDVTAELAAHRQELDLPRFCKESASLDQLQWLVEICQQFPKIAQAVIDHHGSIDFLKEAIASASFRIKSSGNVLDPPRQPQHRFDTSPVIGSVLDVLPPEHPIKSGALRVITYEATQQTELPSGLDEADAERLLRDGVLIQDRRTGDEVSVPYNVQVEQKLFNPQESGIYEVLVKPGTFERCYVAHQPHGPDGRKLFSTVVRLDEGTRNWLNVHPSRIWCCARIEGTEYDEWYDGLSTPDSLPVSEKYRGSRMMLIGPRANATLPFRAIGTLGDAYGEPSYEVDFSDHCEHGYSDSTFTSHDRCQDIGGPYNDYDSWRDGQRVHLDAKEGTDLRSVRGDLYVPRGYKLLKVEPSKTDEVRQEASKNEPMPCCPGDDGASDPPPIRPGNILDAELNIMSQLSQRVHARTKDASTVQIGDQMMSYNRALVHLVADHGLREKAAREVIKQAGELHGHEYTFFIKHAQPFQGDPYLTHGGPTAPTDPGPLMSSGNEMGWSGPTMTESEYTLPVEGMIPKDNRDAYDVRPSAVGEPMDFDMVQKATNSGQQEVFDTAMIGSMLKAVRDDTMIDQYIPDLIKGMDRLGRILFMFYWHGSQFADRFGKQDMPELEDSLRNTFESLGDVVLFLKQKTIEPYPEEDAVDLNVDETANI